MVIPVTPDLKIIGRWNDLKLRAAFAKVLGEYETYSKIITILNSEFTEWLKITQRECDLKSVKKTFFKSGVQYKATAENPVDEIPEIYNMLKEMSRENLLKCLKEFSEDWNFKNSPFNNIQD